MVRETVPESVSRLFWDVDPASLDLDRDRAFVFERIMSRGTWDAMTWLRDRYDLEAIRAFVREHGARKLAPRDLAYWALVAGLDVVAEPGGARPRWAGP
jgi:hypothetical protein